MPVLKKLRQMANYVFFMTKNIMWSNKQIKRHAPRRLWRL